ncbi:MAG: DUF4412 domain-containing protein [Bacteroidia bacterium]|jgi:hypothetical protein|nr:DUF4412 domain-containing protein [Bacteroidia bacterium]
MKKYIVVLAVFVSVSWIGAAQQTKGQAVHKPAVQFEGVIDFFQTNGIDTSIYAYYIKGNKVKLDNFDPSTKNTEGAFLVDIGVKKMTTISPVRKIYFDQASGAPVKPSGVVNVVKTGKKQVLSGYTCWEYVATDEAEGIRIHYWLASGHFNFFINTLQILNRKDKSSEYFLQIPHTEGMFPMLSIEEDMKGNKKNELKVTKVERKELKDDTFAIPFGYKEFKK